MKVGVTTKTFGIPESRLPQASWEISRKFRFAIVSLAAVACLSGCALLWWLCDKATDVPFLTGKSGAEWILYPKTVDGALQQALPLSTVFVRSFELTTPPSSARVKASAFGALSLAINGSAVPLPAAAARRWKTPVAIELAGLLRSGTNLITATVTNSIGPPALWLLLTIPERSIRTDDSWQTSLAGADWQPAILADQTSNPNTGNALSGSEKIPESIKRVWPAIAWLSLVAIVVVCIVTKFASPNFFNSFQASYYLLVIVLILRASLFLHDLPYLPPDLGFDATAHEDYIQFIIDKHSLPLAGDGWEMYQPPLYYFFGALLLGPSGLSASSESGVLLLRTINGVAVLFECWLALLCLRRIFPKNLDLQCVGLLVIAFLPPHLYLSQYVTNELLAGTFVTAAFYFFLRALSDDLKLWPAWTGIFLGLAMLTKFSVLIVIPLLLSGLFLNALFRREKNLLVAAHNVAGPNTFLKRIRPALCVSLLTLTSCLLVCGWHYGRVWAVSGRPLVGNWESSSAFPWWQDPGYRTASFYERFGQAFQSPCFSSLHSFWDGLYCTLWGDGLVGGASRLSFRPPWDYDLMNVGYVLSSAFTLLLLVGFFTTAIRFFRKPSPEWFVVLGTPALFGLAIFYMSLRVASYAQIKAFYGFATLLPVGALVCNGWSFLARSNRFARIGLWISLLVWTATMCGTYWIRPSDPQVELVRGLSNLEQAKSELAVVNLSTALAKDDGSRLVGKSCLLDVIRADAHYKLGLALDEQSRVHESVQEYQQAIEIMESHSGALNNLAWIRAANPDGKIRNPASAVLLATKACKVSHDQEPQFIGTLAAAYAANGQFAEAVATAKKAIECANLRNRPELAARNQELLSLYLAGKAYVERIPNTNRQQ